MELVLTHIICDASFINPPKTPHEVVSELISGSLRYLNG